MWVGRWAYVCVYVYVWVGGKLNKKREVRQQEEEIKVKRAEGKKEGKNNKEEGGGRKRMHLYLIMCDHRYVIARQLYVKLNEFGTPENRNRAILVGSNDSRK